jgi:hypothetical protein
MTTVTRSKPRVKPESRCRRDVCADSTCERCGALGLEYYCGWHVSGVRHRYRAYAVCGRCSHWAEF